MDSARHSIALVTMMLMPGALLYWFSIHPFVRFWRSVGVRKTFIIHVVAVTALGFGMYLMRGRLLAVEYGTNPVLVAISIPILIVGSVMRRALGRHLKLRIMVGAPELTGKASPQRLLCEGIYGRIRHPRYVEIFLMVLFCALFSNYLAAYVILLASAPMLFGVILIEERELRERFGEEYVRYCARVPRFWPW